MSALKLALFLGGIAWGHPHPPLGEFGLTPAGLEALGFRDEEAGLLELAAGRSFVGRERELKLRELARIPSPRRGEGKGEGIVYPHPMPVPQAGEGGLAALVQRAPQVPEASLGGIFDGLGARGGAAQPAAVPTGATGGLESRGS